MKDKYTPLPNPSPARGEGFYFTADAVLFDLDGTLVDSAPDLAAAVNRMLAELGRAEQPTSVIAGWIGNGMARLVKRALIGERQGEPDAALFERALDLFKRHYAAHLTVMTRPYSDAVDALDTLSTQGFALGCITNKPAMFTEPLLQRLNLAKYFKVVLSGDSLPQKKPDPLPLLHACRQLGVGTGRAVLIGDSAADVDAARAAGIPVIGVSYGYTQGRDVRELKPDLVVDSLAQVPQYLRLSTA